MTPMPRALIAEDEPLLAASLQTMLQSQWPALEIAVVGDGLSAVAQGLAWLPDMLFFDIKMPGLSGLEAAAELMDAWPVERALPALVMVTAYDQFALQAFDAQAVDYLLKPVVPERLAKTLDRLRARIATDGDAAEATLAQLRALLDQRSGAKPTSSALLTVIQASENDRIHLVPVSDIVCFEAADKYVRVLTAEREFWIRTPLKELLPQLDGAEFWQIHRSTVVRVQAIDVVHRDEMGKQWLRLRGRTAQWAVSRLYAHRFKAM